MDKFFLEVDSTYRDRNQYPNPGKFSVISQSSVLRTDKTVGGDVVCNSAPIAYWTSHLVDPATAGPTLTCTIDETDATNFVAGVTAPNSLIIVSAEMQETNGYYNGLVLNNTTIGILRRIKSYTYLGNNGGSDDRALVILEEPYPDTFNTGDTVVIKDPSDFSVTDHAIIFVPNGREGDNAYAGYSIYNESNDSIYEITKYNGITKTIILEGTTISGWTEQDNFSIRRTRPENKNSAGSLLKVAANSTTTDVNIINGSTVQNDYEGDYMRIIPVTGEVYPVRETAPIGQMRKIKRYTYFDGIARSVVDPFGDTPPENANIEILRFSRNNPSGLNGNIPHSTWEVRLVNVALPNKELASGTGRRINYYPFVYIELSSGSSNSRSIVSNNPYSTTATFRCVIRDTTEPSKSAFINIDGDGTTQYLDIDPRQGINFAIRLPNGDYWELSSSDTTSPQEPNFLLQISALFQFSKKTPEQPKYSPVQNNSFNGQPVLQPVLQPTSGESQYVQQVPYMKGDINNILYNKNGSSKIY